MKTVKIFATALLLFTLISCETEDKVNSVDLEIINNSDKKLDIVYLSTIHDEAKTKDYSVGPNSKISAKFDFKKVAKADGSYSLFFKYEDFNDTLRQDFGYYTNGYPLDSEFTINIYTDSVKIESVPRHFSLY